jgi:hypothetical protein
MTYSLVVPSELEEGLYHIREATGVSIRKQILLAVTKHIGEYNGQQPISTAQQCDTSDTQSG